MSSRQLRARSRWSFMWWHWASKARKNNSGVLGIKPGPGKSCLSMDDRRRRFEAQALPHLDAAYNLARWLSRSPADADDIVQEAMLRAYRAFDGFRGGDVRPWLLAIVRNCWRNAGADIKRRNH